MFLRLAGRRTQKSRERQAPTACVVSQVYGETCRAKPMAKTPSSTCHVGRLEVVAQQQHWPSFLSLLTFITIAVAAGARIGRSNEPSPAPSLSRGHVDTHARDVVLLDRLTAHHGKEIVWHLWLPSIVASGPQANQASAARDLPVYRHGTCACRRT
jgi:hypothetical protein